MTVSGRTRMVWILHVFADSTSPSGLRLGLDRRPLAGFVSAFVAPNRRNRGYERARGCLRNPMQFYDRLAALSVVAENSADFAPTAQQLGVQEVLAQSLAEATRAFTDVMTQDLPRFSAEIAQDAAARCDREWPGAVKCRSADRNSEAAPWCNWQSIKRRTIRRRAIGRPAVQGSGD